MGSTPYVGGGFGHFYAYAPVKIKYAIDRFTMEVKRQLDVLAMMPAISRRKRRTRSTRADNPIVTTHKTADTSLRLAPISDPRRLALPFRRRLARTIECHAPAPAI